MLKKKSASRLVFIFTLVVIVLSGPFFSASLVWAQDKTSAETIFTIPVGDAGIHYENVGVPESLVWGPASITIDQNYNFWVTDTVMDQILQFDETGFLVTTVKLPPEIIGATDLVVDNSTLLVLDQASFPPKVVRLSIDGIQLESFELPKGLYLGNGLTGISQGNHGELFVEREFGGFTTELLDGSGKLVSLPEVNGIIYNERLFSAKPSGIKSSTPKHGVIRMGEIEIAVDTSFNLGGLQILGVQPSGDFFVILEEVSTNPAIQVDQTVRHYASDGKLLGMARVPIQDGYTYVFQNLAIAPDGSVYLLITYPDHAEVKRLTFVMNLDSILTSKSVFITQSNTASIGLRSCDRTSMENIALDYDTHYRNYTSTNVNGTTTCNNNGRTKPSYFGSAGYYWSVPYAWNMGDSLATFDSLMDSGYTAGDADGNDDGGCSRGVDCSGFVSNVWGISKVGTCGIEDYSEPIEEGDLLTGDIMNFCNSHTVLFYDLDGTSGIYDFESTTYNDYDRVVFITSAWSRFYDYTPRRFSDCPMP